MQIYILMWLGNNNSISCDRNNPRYIGCYVDDPYRDLNQGPGEASWKFVASRCNDICSGYRYFSLQYGGQCFCGNSYATASQYQKRPDKECGGANGTGGEWRNSVYKTCGN